MEKKDKYLSTHQSLPYLNQNYYLPPQPFNKIQTKMITRPQLQRNYPSIDDGKQNSIMMRNSPYQNDFSYLANYNKPDQFSQMQSYLSSIYGRKIQKRRQQQFSFQQRQQKFRQQNIVLPSILIKRNQCIKDRQTQQMKRLKQLEERFSKLALGYNRLQQHQCPIHGQQYLQRQCHCERNNCQKNHNQIQNSNKKEQQAQKPRVSPQRRKRLLSKFRVIGYAVYFAVIFPHYSYLFGHYKLKQFLSKYLVDDNSYIRKMNSQLQEKFKQIPLYENIRQIHQQYEQSNNKEANNSKNKTKQQDPKIKISNELTNENYVINLNVFKKIVTMMISTYAEFVEKLNEEELEFLGVGMLNTSYYGDQIYSIEEMPFINCHQEKGNIKVSKKQQKALLLSNFVIKRIIYQNLVRLAIDPQWHQQMATYSILKQHQIEFFKIICKEIQLCALYLYQMAIKNFYMLIQNQQEGNFNALPDSSLPIPLKTMIFPTLFMTGSEKLIFNHGFGYFGELKKQEKKHTIQGPYKLQDKKKNNKPNKHILGTIQKFQSKYDWSNNQKQVFQQYQQLIQEDPLNLIHNSAQFGQLSDIISQYMKSSSQKIQKSMMKMVDKLVTKVYLKRRKNYKRYHQSVMRKKYILTKQHEVLQGVVFLRSQQKKKIVAMSRRMLEIYTETLQDFEFEARDGVGDLNSKRQIMRNTNGKNKNNSKKNKSGSMVSIMTYENDKNESVYGGSSQMFYKRSK